MDEPAMVLRYAWWALTSIFQSYWAGGGGRVCMMWLLILLVKLHNPLTSIIHWYLMMFIATSPRLLDCSYLRGFIEDVLIIIIIIIFQFFKNTHVFFCVSIIIFAMSFYVDNKKTFILYIHEINHSFKVSTHICGC